jgi:hypothetical protein
VDRHGEVLEQMKHVKEGESVKFAAWSSLAIGVLMLGQWAVFLGAGQVPEIRTEPIALGFHLVAEAATAVALISAGALLLRERPLGITVGLVANGMLIYTVIVSPGYFAQLGQWPLVAMFAVLLALAIASVVQLQKAWGVIRPDGVGTLGVRPEGGHRVTHT